MNEPRHSSFEEILELDGKLIYKNKGVSMMPLIREGKDLMVIEKAASVPYRKYDAVLFKRENGIYVLHRILKKVPDGYWIVGDHCYAGENVNEHQILGVLTAVIRGGSEIPVTDFGYRLYVHLWCDFYPLRFLILRAKAFFAKEIRKLRSSKE